MVIAFIYWERLVNIKYLRQEKKKACAPLLSITGVIPFSRCSFTQPIPLYKIVQNSMFCSFLSRIALFRTIHNLSMGLSAVCLLGQSQNVTFCIPYPFLCRLICVLSVVVLLDDPLMFKLQFMDKYTDIPLKNWIGRSPRSINNDKRNHDTDIPCFMAAMKFLCWNAVFSSNITFLI